MTDQALTAELGIIGGTGLYELDGLEKLGASQLETRWGTPSSEIMFAELGSTRVAFLARHGQAHTIPPHRVNYRANLWALKECGVKQVIAVAAVGGINKHTPPAAVVIPDQVIDYTYGRDHTYFEDELDEVVHVDFTKPYTESLRERLMAAARQNGINAVDGGVYAATQGPRLETAAEIQRMKQDGCDIVGMTGMPEAVLARELGLDYACCALVVNWAAGCYGTDHIDHDEMFRVVDRGMQQVRAILQSLITE